MSVVFRDDQFIPIQGMYGSDWRADRTKAGAGTLLEHSIHDLDLLEWLVGPVAGVAGRTETFHGIDGIEDLTVATLAYAGGGLASLTSVWHDILSRPSLRRVEVFCERAHYVLEGDVFGPIRWTRDGERAADGTVVADEGVIKDDALLAALAAVGITPRNPDGAFVEAVLAGTPASPGFADALRAHELVDAIYASAGAETPGTPVDVTPSAPSR
jgi:UDP-N-acetyl-2-amino-2-deoxyglucuronate dehydrogenase